jgi:hypothetical protein
MLEYIANNPLLAPLPISILIAGVLILLVIVFWVAPIQKNLRQLQDKISKIGSPSEPSNRVSEASSNQGSRFAKIYDQELKAGGVSQPMQDAAKPKSGDTELLSKKSQSNIDLAKQGMRRLVRRNKA